MPPRVDYLYVEQEVLADDTPAVDAVLKADKYALKVRYLNIKWYLLEVDIVCCRVRWALLQEEKQILSELEKKAGLFHSPSYV